MMVFLTFYGGVDEIGGNKILVEDRETKIFLDFGKSFSSGCDFFTGWLSPRLINGLGDYFEFGLLPRIEGLYAKEQLESTNLPYVKPDIDGVFLSHAHLDHMRHIQFLDPQIPIHLGEGTRFFLEAMEKTGYYKFGTHHYHKFRTGDKIKKGSFEVEPVHVDHSIPAAYGYLIHAPEGTIVYTGDLRSHGTRSEMTQEFIDRARESEPIAIICEGTRMVEKEMRQNYSEKQVQDNSDKIASSTNKIIFATHYSRDMDRFRSFYNVATKNNRKLVISPKTAYLLKKLVDDKHLALPDPLKDEDISVYYKKKRSCKFKESDYYKWEREFMNKMITHREVQKQQKDLIMDLDFYQFTELIDIKPDPKSHFIHSMSEPFSEEDIEDKIMHNWLDHFKIDFHQLHASGHMNRTQLCELITQINPRKIFPIHTENQKVFTKELGNVQKVKTGRKYVL